MQFRSQRFFCVFSWEQRKYSNVINLISGQDFEPSQYNENKEGIPYLTGASCIENGHTVAVRWTQTPRCIAEKGDTVLVCKGSGYGTIAVVDQEKAHIARQFMAVKAIDGEIDKAFNYYLLYSVIESIKKDARGLIAGIARDAVLNQPVLIPNIDEQVKIAHSLTNLDNLITLHQRKYEMLKKIKKSFLEKMFPKNGKRIPELRFSGFTDDWEQRKLGDECSEIVAGGDINKKNLLKDGRYPVIANALTDDGIVGYYANEYRIKAPAVTVTGRGDVGHAQARKTNFTPVVRLLSVISKHNVDFLAEAINQNEVVLESTGVPQLTVPTLANYLLRFPSTIEEEKKIGQCFSQIDHLITLHQRMQKSAF